MSNRNTTNSQLVVKLTKLRDNLDNLFKQVKLLSDEKEENLDIKSHFARYLCICVSGFIEQSVRTILLEATKKQSSDKVANFVEKQLEEKIQNPKLEKILILIGSFSNKWRNSIENKIAAENGLKEAIDSIVNTRNSVAHGGDLRITYVSVKEYYDKVKKVIDIIKSECQ